ncbi:hypothetical protein T492DRAFT_1012156, partial [Pavlovales sp. CCMP2436]
TASSGRPSAMSCTPSCAGCAGRTPRSWRLRPRASPPERATPPACQCSSRGSPATTARASHTTARPTRRSSTP